MQKKNRKKILVLMVDALDNRWINKNETPFLFKSKKTAAYTMINTFLGYTTSFMPSFWTGTYPKKHGYFAFVRRNDHPDKLNVLTKATRFLPDLLTSWSSIIWKTVFSKPGKLDILPPVRKNNFQLMMFDTSKKQDYAGEVPTLFNLLKDRCIYERHGSYSTWGNSITKYIKRPVADVGVFYLTELDGVAHYNSHDSNNMKKTLFGIDNIIADTWAAIKESKEDIEMMILSDHGQETVSNILDVRKLLKEKGFNWKNLNYFIDSTMVRFWPTPEQKKQLIPLLQEWKGGRILSENELKKYHVWFPNGEYGTLIFLANPGTMFPTDLHHYAENIRAFTKTKQWSLLFPKEFHGFHGYSPDEIAAKGVFYHYIKDENIGAISERQIVDIFPHIYSRLGIEIPSHVDGSECDYAK